MANQGKTGQAGREAQDTADSAPADSLTPRQYKAIGALLSESSIRKASEVSGVPERTLYQWLKNGEFDAAYRAARREAVEQATARLQRISSKAVETLDRLMTCGKHAIEHAAARTVLEFAIKAVEIEDIQARLDALEQAHAKDS